MKKHIPLSLALVGLLTLGGVGTAVAVGDNPAPTAGQTLADYMGDDNDAQWDKVQTWVEAEYGDGATVPPAPEPEPTDEPTTDPTTPPAEPTPEPTPTEEPTEAPSGIESGEVTWTETGVTFEGKITGTKAGDRVQIRTDTKELTGQRGFYEYEFVRTDGTVKFTLADYSSPQDKLFWHIARGGGEFAYGDVVATGEVTKPAAEPTPEPTAPTTPTTGEGTTGGSGGSKTDQLNRTFSADGLSSDYHIFAGGLDWSKPVGLLMYADGTGGYGFDNPNATYLLDADGTQGLVATAKKHNLLLVVPNAPGKSCDGGDNCWFDNKAGGVTETTVAEAEAKARWSDKLMTKVKGQYDLDQSRIVIGGYSSGAQWTSRYFAPRHAETQSVDLAIPIAYGGDPAGADPTWSEAYKDDIKMSWDTGKKDAAYSTSSWAAIGGYNWYTDYLGESNTDYLWPDGVGHSRGGQFAGIMDREITEHLK